MNEFENETVNVLQEQLDEEIPQEEPFKKPKIKISPKQIVSLVCIICCLSIVVVGILTSVGTFYTPDYSSDIAGVSGTTYTSHKAYGGDAYTGIQQAAADASNNAAAAAYNVGIAVDHLEDVKKAVNNQGEMTHTATGIVIVAIGVVGTCYFAMKFTESFECEH